MRGKVATFKCKMCGGLLDVKEGQSVVECEFCGTKQTVPHFDSEKKSTFFKRANDLRFKCEFDKASGIYETIVTEFPNEAEAYWGLVLCKYGIEYVDDPKTHNKIPTCHRTQFSSIFDDHDYKSALKYADIVAKGIYKEEAANIDKLQKSILAISSKEEPFDIFICYKETDDRGGRTIDSVLAQDIYDDLIKEGYKVFFARRTLERLLGNEYEPYIFAALHSAKIMLHVTTSSSNSESTWVRNEWSRYLSLIADGQKKALIPCYKNISPYELPEEMRNLQGQDLSKIGAMQDLLYGISKILKPKKANDTVGSINISNSSSGDSTYDSLIRKGYLYLKNNKFDQAEHCFDMAIDSAELCGEAYLGKLLCDKHCSSIDDLVESEDSSLFENENYKLAIDFANQSCKETLKSIEEKVKYNETFEIYVKGKDKLDNKDYDDAREIFLGLGDFLEAKSLADECMYQKGCNYLSYLDDIRYIEYADKAKECFATVKDYKDSVDKISEVNNRTNAIINEYIERVCQSLVIPYGTPSLKSIDVVCRKIIDNEKYLYRVHPMFDEIRNRCDEIKKEGYAFIKSKSAAVITSIYNLDDLNLLSYSIRLLKDNRAFTDVFDLIKVRTKEIYAINAIIRKKKIKKFSIIGLISSAVVAVVVVASIGIKALVDKNARRSTYNEATELMESGEYIQAAKYYASLGDYDEAKKKVNICAGLLTLNNARTVSRSDNITQGIRKIVENGETVQVNYLDEGLSQPHGLYNGMATMHQETINSADFTLYEPITGYVVSWITDSLTYKDDLTTLNLKSGQVNLKYYAITYYLNGGGVASGIPHTYTIETDSFTLKNPTKIGHTFTGWSGTGISGMSTSVTVAKGSIGDRSYTAHWDINQYTLTVASADNTKGTVSGGGSYNYGTQVAVTATPVDDCVFNGWYSDSSLTTKVSSNNPYIYTIPATNSTLYAKFFTKAEEEKAEEEERLAKKPVVSSDGKTITYGLYPQTVVSDFSTVSALNNITTAESNGYYLYNNDYYAKQTAYPYNSSYKFDNGTTISSGTTYWFKCEPIVWNVLSNSNGEYYVVSSKLLDAHRYYTSMSDRTINNKTVYANNYEYSDIRAWLNGYNGSDYSVSNYNGNGFLNIAFALNSEYIISGTVDNSASTTNSNSNTYACSNTTDKIFLPSYKDYTNSSYGFLTSTGSTNTIYCKTTDYARARGAHYNTNSSYQYNGWYWTRSPNSDYSNDAWVVGDDGYLNGDYVHYPDFSVRPALRLSAAN